MSSDFYCKSSYWDTGIGAGQVVSGRCRLLSLVARRKVVAEADDVCPIILRNKDATGDARYGFVVPASSLTGATRMQGVVPVDFGGDGILFEDGIYLEISTDGMPGDTDGSGSESFADTITFFYRES